MVVAGYGHLAFRDRAFEEEGAQLLAPSLANGYPYSLIHLYQYLANAALLGLPGQWPSSACTTTTDCVFTDRAAVRRYLDGRDVEIVAGGHRGNLPSAGRGRSGAHLH